ncbi:hypothetical protein [Myroides fluvii]|uniref:hypothetical protein n=1 Tax=Myroides fluvii TaxID=2572594 RepID=UPI00131C1CAC|nr:hypothetical protein [Myroides fluvii]
MIKKYFVFFFLFLCTFSWGQGTSIFLKFTTVASQADELGHVSPSLEISNLGQSEWVGNVQLEGNSSFITLSSAKTKALRLPAGQKMYIPILAHVDQSSSLTNDLAIKAQLIPLHGPAIPWVEHPILIQKNRRILLTNPDSQLQFRQVGDSILIKAIIQNRGNTTEKVHYIVTLPNQLNKTRTEALNFTIRPFQDTLVTLLQYINKEAYKLEDFDISTTLLYENGDFIGRTLYSISSLKSKRRYRAENQYASSYNPSSSIELNRVMGKNVMAATQLIGSGTVQFSEHSQLGLTADLIHWDKENKVNLRHFLADFQTKNIQVQAGNLFQSGEFSLQGRGVQTQIKLQDSLYIQAGYLDKTYLISDSNDRSVGYNTWVGFQSQKHAWKHAQFYYDVNHRYGEKKILQYNSFALWNKPILQVDFNQGGSVLQTDETSQLGVFLGLNAYATLTKYQIQHNSFYSSPYYAGVRQGVSQAATTIRRNMGKHSVGLIQHFIDYAPKYSYTNSVNAQQQSNALGMSYSYRMASSTLLVSPQYVQEKRFNYQTATMEKLQAVRFHAAYHQSNFAKGFGYNASIDLGNYITQTEIQERLHYRLNVGANYKNFDLGVSYQYNYNNLSELINASYYDWQVIHTYTNLMIMGNYRQRFFNNQLGIVLSGYYNNTSTSGDFWQFNTRVEYKLKKDFDIYVSNYNNYGGFSAANQTNYFQVGLVKQLTPYKAYEKLYNLNVLVYYQDENQNILPASNRVVTINQKAFITNVDGSIDYKKLPAGTYTVQVQNDQHWFMNALKLSLDSNLSQVIYLTQTTTITGSIHYEYAEHAVTLNKNLAGQRVVAQNNIGESYTAYTSDEGRYSLYLPKGDYTVTVYPDQPNQVEVLQNTIKVNTTTTNNQVIDFNIQVKSKDVQVKKFKAISF